MYSRKCLGAILMMCGLATGCSQFNTNLTQQTSSSSISFVSPASVAAGGSNFTLTVNGVGFVSNAIVLWNGTALTTTFVSSSMVTAVVPAANIATAGTAKINVQIVGSAVSGSSGTSATTTTEVSNQVNISILASIGAAPTITQITPSSIGAGSSAFPLTVTGTGFVSGSNGSVIYWNGSPLTTTVSGTTTATAMVPANLVATAGTASVISISNASSGGSTSTAANFTVTSAAPSHAVVGQSNAQAGNGAQASAATSSDRRFLVFTMPSMDGTSETPGTTENVFVRDTCNGAASDCATSTSLISVGIDGQPADGDSASPSISADGRYVAFVSSATNLSPNDTNGLPDVFLRDTCLGAPSGCVASTGRISISSDGTQANDASLSASISANGRYVTFRSQATNLDPVSSSGSSGFSGIFVRDMCTGVPSGCTPTTQRLSLQN